MKWMKLKMLEKTTFCRILSYDSLKKVLTKFSKMCTIKTESKRKGEKAKKENQASVQEWLPFEKILNNGVIKINSTTYLRMIKIIPINYQLKSELEKEAILNSYRIFLKTCNCNLQIIIQNTRPNIFQFISKIPPKEKDPIIVSYIKEYQQYIQNFHQKRKLCHKNFYLILKNSNTVNTISENKRLEELTESYYKIKESLSRCGNFVELIETKQEILDIITSFFHPIEYHIKEGEENI